MAIGESESNVASVFRVGQRVATATRPRTIILRFANEWSAQKCLAKSYWLKEFDYPVFVSKSLNKAEIKIENRLLKKRKLLIDSGVPRKELKLRNLKFFRSDVEIVDTKEEN